MATISYEGATLTTITTGSGNIYVQLTLPSGRTFPNVYQWGVMWQDYIDDPNTTPEDKQVLIGLQANQGIIDSLYAQAQQEQTPPETLQEGANTELPNDSETGQNQADDDQGQFSNPTNTDVKAAGNDQEINSTVEASSVYNSGTTTAGKSDSSSLKQGKSPVVRPNPLGYLSSYAYQLTLYMLTADALNAFRASGRRNINDLIIKSGSTNPIGGAYVILQSGGVNNTVNSRAPEFDLDFYFDNLQIKSLVSTNANRAPTVATTMSFNIIEPYGFSFLSKLQAASTVLEKYSKIPNVKMIKNATRHFFVLGIRFQGYDKHGNLLTGKETIDGKVLDQNATNNGLFERFYEIIFKKVNFKIDGKATTYNIEAISLNSDAQSTKNGMIPTQVTTEAETVDEAIQGKTGLLTIINAFYKKLNSDISPIFKVDYIGDINDLKDAKIVVPNDTLKYKWPIRVDPNDPTGARAVRNSTKRQISFSNTPSISIVAAIEKIIVQSTFLRNPLKVAYQNDIEPNQVTKDDGETKVDEAKVLRWFNITTNSKIIGYSDKTNDWVYETTFVISPYETPVVLSTYVKNFPKYYGPHKRYEYWFTGKNSEILNYEQTNNNGYFLVSRDPNLDDATLSQIATRAGFQQDSDKTGGLYANPEAAGSVTTNLYDPKSYAMAKITILGDPDFLCRDSLNYDPATKAFNQFYAPDGYTVNPTGGQIFVEINFKEGIDYNYKTGTMDINDSITFWRYPDAVKKIVKGVSYHVIRITHNFKGGKFTQDLEMYVNSSLTENTMPNQVNGGRDASSTDANNYPDGIGQYPGTRQGTGSVATQTGDTTSSNTGLTPEPVPSEAPPEEQPEIEDLILLNDPDIVYQDTVYYGDEEGGREGE